MMMLLVVIILLVPLVHFYFLLVLSCTSYITVTGKVGIRGNEPFAYLSIASEESEYEIKGSLGTKIENNLQGQTITVKINKRIYISLIQ